MITCIGHVVGNKLRAVVGYDNHNGSSCAVHVAGEGRWLTKEFLHAIFHYPFVICDYKVLLAFVPSGNEQSKLFVENLGFELFYEVKGGHPDGALLIYGLRKEQCRYLRSQDGQEVVLAAASA
jgi:hypothetical protein